MKPRDDLHESVLVSRRVDLIDIFLQRGRALGVQPCGVESLLVKVGNLLLDRAFFRFQRSHLGEQVVESLDVVLPQLVE